MVRANSSKWTGLALELNSLEVGRYGRFVFLFLLTFCFGWWRKTALEYIETL